MGVLGHTAALVGVEENVVNIERGGNHRLVVSDGGGDGGSGAGALAVECGNRPQALVNGANVKIDLYFVVLYEPLLPPLSRYLSAVSFRSTIT